MAILRKIFQFLTLICYLFIAIYLVISIPILFGYNPVVVLSGSMEPTFNTGSIIYYKPVNSESDISVNDVISYKLNNQAIVTHRIIGYIDDLYLTKGDANNTADSQGVSYEQVLGKVGNWKIPYLGYFVQYVNEHYFIVAIVLGILIIQFILSSINNKKKEKENIVDTKVGHNETNKKSIYKKETNKEENKKLDENIKQDSEEVKKPKESNTKKKNTTQSSKTTKTNAKKGTKKKTTKKPNNKK